MKYSVLLSRTIDQTVTIEVEAKTVEAAEAAALVIAEQTLLDWEFDCQIGIVGVSDVT
jgi:hypothetical protein